MERGTVPFAVELGALVFGVSMADKTCASSITSSALTQGAHTLTAKATDTAGNVSVACSIDNTEISKSKFTANATTEKVPNKR